MWTGEVLVEEVAGVESGLPIRGNLSLAPDILSGIGSHDELAPAQEEIRLFPGEVFSLGMQAYNDGDTMWQRERSSIEGSVVITAVWTREGDPDYEMVQQGMLPGDISPGQFPAFPIALQAPTEAGSYTLTLRLNCLAITYIGDPVVIPVTVSREISVPQTVP